MNKTRRNCLVCIVIVCALILFPMIVKADWPDNIGKKEYDRETLEKSGISLNGDNMDEYTNLFCINHSKEFHHGRYVVTDKVYINGIRARLRGYTKTWENDIYAKMLYVFSKKQNYGYFEKRSDENYYPNYADAQYCVYHLWNSFAGTFDKHLNKTTDDAGLTDGAKRILNEADIYAAKVRTFSSKKNINLKVSFVDEENISLKENIKSDAFDTKICTDGVKSLLKTHKNWVKIGPIQIQGNTDKITSVKLSGSIPKDIIYKYETKNVYSFTTKQSDAINFYSASKKTNKFYIFIPYEEYVKKGLEELNISVDAKETCNVYEGYVEVLENKTQSAQRLMKGYVKSNTLTINGSASLKLKLTRKLKIVKKDKITGINLTTKVRFRLIDAHGNAVKFKTVQKVNKDGKKYNVYEYEGVILDYDKATSKEKDLTWITAFQTITNLKLGNYAIREMIIDTDAYKLNEDYSSMQYDGKNYPTKKLEFNIPISYFCDVGEEEIQGSGNYGSLNNEFAWSCKTNNGSKYIEVQIVNEKNIGDLLIYKVDKDDNTHPLKGVKFAIVYNYGGKKFLLQENGKSKYKYNEMTKNAKTGEYVQISKESKNKYTEFETNKDGKIKLLEGIQQGSYELYEVSNGDNKEYLKVSPNEVVEAVYTDSNGKENKTKSVKVNADELNVYKVYNEKKSTGGKLKIYKKDVNTNIPIPGVQFKIKYLKTKEIEITKNGKKIKKTAIIGEQYVVQDSKTGKVTYVDDANKATTFETNADGILQGYNSKGEKVDYIGGLEFGQYKAIELKQDGNGTYSTAVDFEISEGAEEYVNPNDRTKDDFTKIEVTEENDKDTYRIYNTIAPMKGNVSIEGKVWSPKKADDKAQETVNEEQAIEYKNGYNFVKGIKVNIYAKARLIVTVKETGEIHYDEKTKTPTEYQEQLKYYEFDPSDGHAYQVNANGSRIKDQKGNDIDLGEELVIKKGTIVSSKMVSYSKEKLVATVYTDEKGKYISTLRGVPYPDTQLPYYRVEFQYDGIDFQGARIARYYDKENGSKAIENISRRTVINNAYETIKGNGTKNGGTALNANRNLEYTFKEGNDNGYGTSTSKGLSTGYKKSDKLITVNDIEKATNDVKNNNMITASYSLKKDEPTGNPGALGDYDDSTEEKETYYDDNQKKVEGINLMLMEREMPDLSVSNRIESVVTSINGYNNLYKTIASKDNNDPDNAAINLQVKYVQDEERLGKIPVYPSDVAAFDITNTELKQRLQLYITYKVSIVNNSATLYNRVKELALYYNTEGYELLYVGTGLDNTKNNYCAKNDMAITTNKYSGNTIPLTGYSRVCIDLNNTVIEPGDNKSKDLYITYKIKDDYVKGAINGNNNINSLKHIAEINAYSTYSDTEGTEAYAGVDKNSAPGNITNSDIKFNDSKPIIGNIDNDTGIARAAGLNVQENRTMTGTVFLDKSTVKNDMRISDGIYDKNNEKALAGVKVKLEIVNTEGNNIITGENIATQMPKNIVIKDQNNKYHTCAVEQENGKYYYRYNNLKIELYTATTSETGNNNNYKISGYIPGNYKLTYTYNNETYYKDSDGKQHKINTEDYKSAIVQNVDGGTIIRSAFEDNSNNMNWYMIDNASTEEELQKEFTRYNEAVDDMNTRKTIDNYYSNMNMTNTGNTNDSLIKNKNYDMTASTPVMGIPVEKTISIDTTSTGNELKNLSYDIKNMDFGIVERPRQSLKLEKKINSVKIKLSNGQLLVDVKADENGKFQTVQGVQIINGAVHIEFDNELIHGSTLELGYKIKVENNSEVDYINETFYKYGEVILDGSEDRFNTCSIEEAINKGIKGADDYKVKLSPQEILDYVDNNLIYTKDDNSKWNIINKGDYTNKIDNAEIYDNTEKSKINTILSYNIKENNNSIELAPGDTYNNIPEIKLEKLLSNTQDDEMLYGNKVEVITVNQGKAKEGNNNLGRRINIQLGTYNKAGDSGIGAKAENVTITPPTGQDNISKIYYTIIALGVLVIIAGGIVLIRHNIKKNK